jgi:hypothetical protein
MQEEDDEFSVTNEDTEILNLPLYTERIYTERKADGVQPTIYAQILNRVSGAGGRMFSA